jgi:outer membrane lipoprotein-sorting protein
MSPNNQKLKQEDLGFLEELIKATKTDAPEERQQQAAQQNLLQKLNYEQKESLIMSAIKSTFQTKFRLASAAGIAVIVVVVLVFGPFGQSPNRAFAAVAEQLRNAMTVSFSATWHFNEDDPPTVIEMAFRKPGIQRIEMAQDNGVAAVQLYDSSQNKTLILVPANKTYVEMEMGGAVDPERERLGLIDLICKDLGALSGEADEILEECVLDGRKVQGFRIGDKTFWIDVEAKTLVSMDKPLGATRMVLSNFRIDPPELSADMFSLEPPAGYTAVTDEVIVNDLANTGAEDLVTYLRMVASITQGRVFPSTLNPLQVMTLMQEGKLVELEHESAEAEQQWAQDFVRICPRMVMFITQMQPKNDWSYVGGGVTLGDAATPIAWWKPVGAAQYRILWGDLTITNQSADTIPPVKREDK